MILPDEKRPVPPPLPPRSSGTSGTDSSVASDDEDFDPTDLANLDVLEIDGPGLKSAARLNRKGRINVTFNMKKALPELPPDYQRPVVEWGVDPSRPLRVPPLSIVIFIVGSRGDVQPYLVAALRLILDFGHRVRIATHGTFEAFVLEQKAALKGRTGPNGRSLEQNLEFFDVGGDPHDLMAYMVKNPGLLPGMASLTNGDIPKKRKMIRNMLRAFWKSTFLPSPQTGAAFAADAILSNPPAFAHIHVAEALGIPLTLSFPMPYSATTAFSHPLVSIKQSNTPRGLTNYLSFAMAETLTWQGLGGVINRFRRVKLGLDVISVVSGASVLDRLKVPFIYCWSSALIPKPPDWMQHIDITGFLFLESQGYQPPPDLARFLESGPPPIYIGFGSIVVEDPKALTNLLLEAVAQTGVRALISAGWSKMGAENLPENVFILGNVPHDWLFANQRVAAVCHHGGAGTVAIGLRNGLPTIVVPFFGDQPFWGAMIARQGAGPEPIPFKHLTVDKLVEAIRVALSPETLAAAQSMGQQIREQDGAKEFVDSFHAHLPLLHMRCDILPGRVAVWWHDKLALRLSGLAAEALIDAGKITEKSLEPWRPSMYDTRRRTPDPISGGTAAALEVCTDFGDGLGMLFTKPVKGLAKITYTMPVGIYNMLNGVTEGFEELPSLYGTKQRERTKVTGTTSGLVAGGKSLYHGLADGFSAFFMDPYRGAKKNGVIGFSKGIATGSANLLFQPTAGMLGFVAHPLKGLVKDTERAFRPELAEQVLATPRHILGRQDFLASTRDERVEIDQVFEELLKTTPDRKAELKRRALDWLDRLKEQAEATDVEVTPEASTSQLAPPAYPH